MTKRFSLRRGRPLILIPLQSGVDLEYGTKETKRGRDSERNKERKKKRIHHLSTLPLFLTRWCGGDRVTAKPLRQGDGACAASPSGLPACSRLPGPPRWAVFPTKPGLCSQLCRPLLLGRRLGHEGLGSDPGATPCLLCRAGHQLPICAAPNATRDGCPHGLQS